VWGEILTPTGGRWLPECLRIPQHERLFDIPAKFTKHQLTALPHYDEVIVSLPTGEDRFICSFLMSQLPHDCALRAGLDDVLGLVREYAQPLRPANGG
jgi:hypothetical protein